jgi:dTDP-4-dehydrorhamnose 3,5-epimerase
MNKKILDIKIIKLKPFRDFRGTYVESFNEKKYKKKFNIKFVQDDFSSSKKGILRGFHGDSKTWKLFSCIKGKVQFAFINNDNNSKKFKKNFSICLNEKSNLQILVPPNYGTAHLVLSKNATIHYKQSTYYKTHKQFTINHKNKCLRFRWLLKKIIVSERDKNGKIFK